MDKRQKTDASKLVLFVDCTGGTVYVVSFPPFYNMLRPSRAYETEESRRVIHPSTLTPEYLNILYHSEPTSGHYLQFPQHLNFTSQALIAA
jgi:hypothetical protein